MQWADATAWASRLGARDYLLAVAVEDRQYGYVVEDRFVLDDASLQQVASTAESHLAENPARAAITAATAIGEAVEGTGRLAAGQDASADGTKTMSDSATNLFGMFVMLLFASSAAALALGKRSPASGAEGGYDTGSCGRDDSPSRSSGGGRSSDRATRGGGGSF
jgi:hypothetical protein